MAKQTIGIGSSANDGTGDPLRTAFDKINDNFDELYGTTAEANDLIEDATPQLGGDLDVNGRRITSARTNEDIVLLPAGTGGVVASAIRLAGTTISADDSSLITIGEALQVNGATNIDGAVTATSTVAVTGAFTGTSGAFSTTLAVTGATTLTGALTVNDSVTATSLTTNDIASNGSNADITLDTAGTGDINLTAGADINIPANIGLTFGDDGEKIEGDGTDLTIAGNNINLTAVADIVVPANVGITFGSGEKIEGDNTDLTITSGGDVTFATTGNVNIATSKLLTFSDDGENISGDGTDITIASGAKINLTATSDVHIPNAVGLVFGDGGEHIETDNTDFTITSGGKINLATASDVHLANDRGIVFGDAGEKIEGNGTNLTITSSGDCTITATGQTVVTNNLVVSGNLTVDGTNTIINTTTLSIEDNLIEVNRTVSAASGMPTYSGMVVNRGVNSTDTEEDLFWVWDESFADDGTTIHGNAGGAFTALRASRGIDNASPITATETTLVDMRCNVLHALATSAQYADVAERFEADAPMTAGAVVMVGGDAEITETTSDLSDQVFGVISDQPAYAMNAAAGNNDSHPFVAMTGRTPVRVTGAVTKGQRLVSSSTKGCARAAATGETISPFNVIGRALESSTDAGIKLVNCAVRTNN